jgi:hypothetical protein
MKLWIFAGAVLVSSVVGFRVWLTFQEEQARHDYETERYCESLDTYKWLSRLMTDSLPLLGAFYAEGLCVQQDVDEARRIYERAYKNNADEVGRAFLYNGIGIAEADIRKQQPLRLEMIENTFAEARKAGVAPSAKDWQSLSAVGLKERFQQQ